MDAMPQQIEVWYVIPSVRKALTRDLIKQGLSQKKASDVLGLTKSAVSQYVSKKRGNELTFTKEINEEIKKSAKKLVEDPKKLVEEMTRLCAFIKKTGFLCKIHKAHCPLIKECRACLE